MENTVFTNISGLYSFFFFFFLGGGGGGGRGASFTCVRDGRTDIAYGPTVKQQIQLQELREGQADRRT